MTGPTTLQRARMRGMTLIEVMISLVILGLMLVSVWSGFKGTLKAMEVTEEIQTRYSIVRNGLARMESELTMTYLSFNRPAYDTRHYTMFEGRDEFGSDSLTFSSFAHLRIRKHADESDQSLVQYFMQKDPEDKQRTHLYRRESRRLTGDLPEDLERYFPAYVVIEDVESFDVKYWDNREMEWLDEWRTTAIDMQPDRLPERVKVQVEVKDPNGDLVVFTIQVVLPMQEKIDLSRT
jgi:general secretion pathway protein J